MERRTYYAPDVDVHELARVLADWYAQQGYQSQAFPIADGGATVQARRESTWRTIVGMSSALTVILHHDGENVIAEMGGAKWAEKAAVGAASLILAAPVFLVTAGVGAYQQTQLQSQSWQFIDNYVRTNSAYASAAPAPGYSPSPGASYGQGGTYSPSPPGGGRGPAPVPPSPQGGAAPPPLNMAGGGAIAQAKPGQAPKCSQCGQPLRAGSKFCDNCGAPAKSGCPNCGQELRPGAKFCDGCGAPIS